MLCEQCELLKSFISAESNEAKMNALGGFGHLCWPSRHWSHWRQII